MGIDYTQKIPNNVDLAGDRRLQRALEHWQPRYLDWWNELGPEGFQANDIYLRTAINVGADGWAHFDHVKMPDYRWGIFLAKQNAERTIGFGDEFGKPVWQDVPGEHRAALRRLVDAVLQVLVELLRIRDDGFVVHGARNRTRRRFLRAHLFSANFRNRHCLRGVSFRPRRARPRRVHLHLRFRRRALHRIQKLLSFARA